MSYIKIKPKGKVIPSLESAQSAKKSEVNQQAADLIKSLEWKEDKRLKDELTLGLPLTMTEQEIAQERQSIRDKSNSMCLSIDSLTNVADVEQFKIEY